jgi:hypothetical protein
MRLLRLFHLTFFLDKTAVFYATGLQEGPHKVTLTNLGKNAFYLDVDFAVVNSTTG